MTAALVLLTACGSGSTQADGGQSSSNGESGSPSGELAYGLQRCSPDVRWVEADPSFYRDEPVYVGNEQPVEQVRSWAVSQPGYEDIWLDRNNNGWISVGFSHDVAARQADLGAEFPDVGAVAVLVPATNAELQALRAEAEAALQGLDSWGSSHSVPRGMVELSVPVLDDETLSRLAPLASPILCVSGLDPVDAVVDGPQPTGGDGWRLLGTDRTGPNYRTGVATTPGQYADLWQLAGLGGELPDVDFDTEIVLWFGAVYGSGCPIRLDDVIVDTDEQLIHGWFVLPGNPRECNADANSEAYVVAIPRSRLPAPPFRVQLGAEDPPNGVPEERTTVQVDLRPVGSVAEADDLVVRFLDDLPPPSPEVFVPGLVIETGFPWEITIDLACSVDVLGPLNGVMWRATTIEPFGPPPSAWTAAADGDLAQGELLLLENPARLTVTVGDTPVDYQPLPANEEADMSCE